MQRNETKRGEGLLPMRAKLVVIGAGIVGCSVVYHLMRRGWTDIVVVDQGPLWRTGGSTSHAPGLVFQTNRSRTMCQLAQYSTHLYGQHSWQGRACYHAVGSIEVATTPARWQELQRKAGWAQAYGLAAALLTPQAVQTLVPILEPATIQGGYYVESDGIAKAVDICAALGTAAMEAGAATFHGNTRVTAFDIHKGSIQAVDTDRGRIETQHVLIAAGIWGPMLAQMAGESVPLIPVEHQYVLTEPLPQLLQDKGIESRHPILRHQDHAMYFRQVGDCYGIGNYRHEPILVEPQALDTPQTTEQEMPSLRPFTPADFHASHQEAVRLLPALAPRKLEQAINGLFSFTPDGNPVLAASARTRGLWIAEAVWVTHAGGVGKVMADLMAHGNSDWDIRELDMQRFPAHAHSPVYVRTRGAQQYREVYDIIHPAQQLEHPRNLRRSPWHHRLVEQQAVFHTSAGWECPQWLEANAPLLDIYPGHQRSGWAARYWSPIQGAEHQATRQRVALYDLTAFTKIQVSGSGALAFLQGLCANDIDRPVGTVVYTALCNQRGGIVSDLTITRTTHNDFLILTGAASGRMDLAWLRRLRPANGSVTISEVTSASAAIGLWGPHARDVLQGVTDMDVGNEAFPYFTAQDLWIAEVPVLAVRISYVGELGWELYCPTEYGLYLWDILWGAGQAYGIIAAGNGALNSLRLEKGYRSWGSDIHSEYTPYEAGLGWAVRLDKGDFIGREALQQHKAAGSARKLCCLTFDKSDGVALGCEPILADDTVIGYVTSADYGYTIGKFILYGYLPLAYARAGTQVEVEYLGTRFPATVQQEPLYDPRMEKIKS